MYVCVLTAVLVPLAEEAVAAVVGKRMAVTVEPKAHLAVAGDLDAMLLAGAKLAGMLRNGTTVAAHGTVVGSSFIHTGEPSTFASDLHYHVKVYVGLVVAPMAAEHITHFDIGLRAWYHSNVVGVDGATTHHVTAVDSNQVGIVAADVGDLVHGIGRQSFAVEEGSVLFDGYSHSDEVALAN